MAAQVEVFHKYQHPVLVLGVRVPQTGTLSEGMGATYSVDKCACMNDVGALL